MRQLKGILVGFFLIIGTCIASAEIHDGMLFRSYDVPAEQRTSMVVSGSQGEAFSFSDSLSLSFSLKLEPNKGKFGYVCRLALDNLLPLDLLLSPESGEPQLCVTADHRNIIPLDWVAERFEEWNDIYLNVVEKGDSLALSVNREPVLTVFSGIRRHHVKAYFGRVDVPGLMTSDVAPMMVADLHVVIDKGAPVSWPLSEASDLVTKKGISIAASNHVFLHDMNRKWTKVWSAVLPTTAYVTVAMDKSTIYFVSDRQMIESDVASARSTSHPFEADMKMRLVAGEFVATPDGSIAYADMETGQFIRYDRQRRNWDAANLRSRMSVHLHHNTVYLDSLAVQMLGYGQHRYYNDIHIWDMAAGTAESRNLADVAPRYLSAAGIKDGKIYVLGGKGNASGLQGLGVQLYDDFIEIDPADWSAHTVWRTDALAGCVPAHDIVFEEGGDSFLTMVYNPEVNDASLQLMRFDMKDGSAKALADPIPYSFTDVSSDARFLYSDEFDMFLAVLTGKNAMGQQQCEIYILGSPVLGQEEACRHDRKPLLLMILAAALLGIIATWFFGRKHATDDEVDTRLLSPAETKLVRPGVYLLGGFHAIDHDGTDITSSFSPILIQLLSIFVLYTEEKGGVTNAMLKALLWPDKSDESFNNNKGVNIKKLRNLLSAVGDVSIVIDGGVWKFRAADGLCDYQTAKARLSGNRTDDVVKAAMSGPLLPEYHFDWLDPFKAGYTDLMLSRLDSLSSEDASPELLLKLSDARIKFDSLDEDAILQKCQALISLGKVGTAQAVFKHFTEEYASVMGEDFPKDFTRFLKN